MYAIWLYEDLEIPASTLIEVEGGSTGRLELISFILNTTCPPPPPNTAPTWTHVVCVLVRNERCVFMGLRGRISVNHALSLSNYNHH
jgi:hypothetical protein